VFSSFQEYIQMAQDCSPLGSTINVPQSYDGCFSLAQYT